MRRSRLNWDELPLGVRLIPGTLEKAKRNDPGYPYPEPAQVPLAEKAKA